MSVTPEEHEFISELVAGGTAKRRPAVGSELLDALSHDLVIETERAIRQRDTFLKTGISTAGHGGSHDTCFPAVLRKHLDPLLAEIERLDAELDGRANWDAAQIKVIHGLNDRIAELEAQIAKLSGEA